MPSLEESRFQRATRRAGAWLIANDNWMTVAAAALFAAFILTGMTTSSIGMAWFSENPSDPDITQIGMPQWIRSDEYNVNSPLWMSMMTTGGPPTLSPLGAPADIAHRFSSGGFFETIVFFPTALLWMTSFLPDTMVFSLVWWLPMIFLVFSLPFWVERMGGTRRMGWLATLLIAFSPSVAWWSLGPVGVLAYAVAGSLALAIAAELFISRRFVRAGIVMVVAGILLASIPTVYAPWSIILGVPVLLATVLRIVATKTTWPQRIVPIAVSGSIALILAAGVFLENREGLESMVGTVYPGSRRSGSLAQSFAMLFGAPGYDALSRHDPIVSNASELSASFTVCVFWAAILIVAYRNFGRVRDNLPLIVLGAWTLTWLGWCTVSTGALGERIPVLNLVPPYRAAQVIGILAIIVVALILSKAPLRRDYTAAIVSAVTVGFVTAYAVSLFREEAAPTMQSWQILAAAGGAAIAVFFVTLFPRKLWPVLLAGVLALLPVVRSQPILFGLGEFRSSDVARTLQDLGAESRADGTYWATDAPGFESLMLANGVPSLSGFQRSGPDVAQWERLDPDHEFEFAWNRGGGYIPFVFAPGEELEITTSGFDTTWVRIDPCDLKERFPELGHIASAEAIDSSCLVDAGTANWSGRTVYLYETP
ncbi:hypothetical protein ESP57_04325 [Agromyces fucosus]|uniref:Uncharacterized protein n=1 Tax=Agromyces fucosus TaxID=41985 RepID=A0A4Q2JXR7_9MICO|nr:hypothetical protein [Agromyces fucosus]RXZ51018.1 hypothetical protein ESP57_04325 [Agromyces fucosus]